MIDLNDVAIFSKVVEAGSFAAAGRALGLPKATVSRRIARLEAALAVRLIHRTTRKQELTVAGREYHETAVEALQLIDRAQRKVETAQATPSGVLRATSPIAFGTSYLVPWLAEFLRLFPAVDVRLFLTDERVDLVARGIDVAFRMGALADSSMIARKLAPTRRVLAASPAYLAATGLPKSIDDLKHHHCVAFGPPDQDTVWRLEAGDEHWDVKIKPRITLDNVAGAFEAVLSGVGVGLLPYAISAGHFETGRLMRVLPEVTIDSGGFYVVYPSDRHLPASLRALIDFIVKKAGSLPV